jgi:hypothetical protein
MGIKVVGAYETLGYMFMITDATISESSRFN